MSHTPHTTERLEVAIRLESELRDCTRDLADILETADPQLAGMLESMAEEAECHVDWLRALPKRAGGTLMQDSLKFYFLFAPA